MVHAIGRISVLFDPHCGLQICGVRTLILLSCTDAVAGYSHASCGPPLNTSWLGHASDCAIVLSFVPACHLSCDWLAIQTTQQLETVRMHMSSLHPSTKTVKA